MSRIALARTSMTSRRRYLGVGGARSGGGDRAACAPLGVWGAEGAEGVCGVPAEVCLAPGAWTHVVVLHDSHVISPELDPPRPGEVWFVE